MHKILMASVALFSIFGTAKAGIFQVPIGENFLQYVTSGKPGVYTFQATFNLHKYEPGNPLTSYPPNSPNNISNYGVKTTFDYIGSHYNGPYVQPPLYFTLFSPGASSSSNFIDGQPANISSSVIGGNPSAIGFWANNGVKLRKPKHPWIYMSSDNNRIELDYGLTDSPTSFLNIFPGKKYGYGRAFYQDMGYDEFIYVGTVNYSLYPGSLPGYFPPAYPVPEPSTFLILGTGVIGLLIPKFKRKSRGA